MICRNCGHTIKEDDEFCGNCGEKVELLHDDNHLNKDYHDSYENHNYYNANDSMTIVKVVAIIMILIALLLDWGNYFLIKGLLAILGLILIGVTQRYTKDGKKRDKREQAFNTFTYIGRIIGILIAIPVIIYVVWWIGIVILFIVEQ